VIRYIVLGIPARRTKVYALHLFNVGARPSERGPRTPALYLFFVGYEMGHKNTPRNGSLQPRNQTPLTSFDGPILGPIAVMILISLAVIAVLGFAPH
jgi:hypothetical protein